MKGRIIVIIENIDKFKNRDKIPKYIKEVREDLKSNVLKTKVIEKYRYLICDYCGKEIRLDKKEEERDGGVCIIPSSLTKTIFTIQLALHNKCLKNVIKEFEDKIKKE